MHLVSVFFLWTIFRITISGDFFCKDQKCIHGKCINDTEAGPRCECDQGWKGQACEACTGRVGLGPDSGYITDGHGNYSLDTKCSWLIKAETPNSTIRLRFNHFATECSWDHLYIFDGDSIYSPLVGVLSGLVIPRPDGNESLPEIVTNSGSAYLHFYSDAAYNMSGFNLTYHIGSCPLECSGHGECRKNICHCDQNWKGPGCEIPACMNDCSPPHGVCKHDPPDSPYCQCQDGYLGIDCSIPDTRGNWRHIDYQASNSQQIPQGRASHKAVVHDGYLWIVSGYDFSNNAIQQLVRYDFDNNNWEVIKPNSPEAPSQRYGHSVVLYDNKIFMFGGLAGKTISDELWMYNIAQKTWLLIDNQLVKGAYPDSKAMAVVGHTAHVVDGIMHIIFGHSPIYGYVNVVQECNMSTYRWREANETTGAIVKGGYGHSSVYDPKTKKIYVHAGYHSGSPSTHNLAEALYSYDPARRQWWILRGSGQYKYLHSAVIISDLMLVFGGNTHNDTAHSHGAKCYSTNFMAYDIECDRWYNLDPPKLYWNIARFGHVAAVDSNKMYIFGGFNGLMMNDMYVYEPANCANHKTSEQCFSSVEGVKCAWADRQRCLLSREAELKKAQKNIERYETAECPDHPRKQEGVCEKFVTCPSCLYNSYGCKWCNSRCKATCTKELQSRSCESKDSSTCKFLHNCNACHLDEKCTWTKEKDCAVSTLYVEGTVLNPKTKQVAQQTYRPKCDLPCYLHTTCDNCTSAQCMWCSSEERCVESNSYVASFPYGQCMEWMTMKEKCPGTKCSEFRTCEACQKRPGCGWCDDASNTGLGSCINGGNSGPLVVEDGHATLQPQLCPAPRWFFTSCPLCQCNGHSTCVNESNVCAGCNDLTTGSQCQYCQEGYWGTPTNGGNCSVCECNDQTDVCDRNTGSCFCRTRGVIGDSCNECDENHKYYGNPKAGGTCYYDLATDYQFTFDLSKPDEKYYTQINFMNTPVTADRDVDFHINCSEHAYMNITVKSEDGASERMLIGNSIRCRDFHAKFSYKELFFGSDHNTTFYVYVFDFKTPFKLQISFSQFPHIDLLHFFVTFFSCFLSLLLIAAILWKVKQKCDVYRRRQQMVVLLEQMASRPFASTCIEVEHPESVLPAKKEPPDLGTSRRKKGVKPSPVALEPLINNKTAILSLMIRLPRGDEDYTPSGQTGIAVGSALVSLGNLRKTSVDHSKGDKMKHRKHPSNGMPDNFL